MVAGGGVVCVVMCGGRKDGDKDMDVEVEVRLGWGSEVEERKCSGE